MKIELNYKEEQECCRWCSSCINYSDTTGWCLYDDGFPIHNTLEKYCMFFKFNSDINRH